MLTPSQQTKPLAASLLSGEPSLVFLTGPRGAGKTTFCKNFVAQLKETGAQVSGFICPAAFENGVKTGIDMLNVATGERRRLGLRSSDESESTIGRWRLDGNAIGWGNQIMIKLNKDDIVIIDELGPLELEEGDGFQEALRLLDEKRYRAALVVVRPALLRLAQLRWPHGKVLDLEKQGA